MTIIPYSINHREVWDQFVRRSKNGTFLFERGFMDYHSDRFVDCSLLVYDGVDLTEEEKEGGGLGLEGLKAVFPANWVEAQRKVYSHQGLTYGGIVVAEDVTQHEVLALMQAILLYYDRMFMARSVFVKPVPSMYSSQPNGEELYALYRAGARLKQRQVSTVVCTSNPLKMRTLRMRQARKAVENDVYVDRMVEGEWEALEDFWHILTHVLERHHQTTPVHTIDEMKLLMQRFPREIKLWLARREGRVIAGVVVFVTRKVAHIQYIAAGEEGRELGALDLLFRHLINERYKSMPYVDFGVSTEDGGNYLNEGLIFQKEGFGGRAVCYDAYEVRLEKGKLNAMLPTVDAEREKGIAYLPLKLLNDTFQPALAEAVEDVVMSGRYLMGGQVDLFEKHFAEYCGTKHCIGVANGLEALTLILRAYRNMLGWQQDDEVIVPANTFIATILAIKEAGLRPVLCEPLQSTFLINPDLIRPLLTPRTRVVLPVHLYGRTCDIPRIREALADRPDIIIVEDAAQAHGAMFLDKRAGSMGHAAAFSFYPGKNLGALGDGGCVTTNDDALAQAIRMMANYGSSVKYVHEMHGMNSRLDELQAAVLNVKLPRLDADNAYRRKLAKLYMEKIQNPLVVLPTMPKYEEHHVFHIFAIRCAHRDELQQYLRSKGIETLIHYPVPPHKQAALADMNGETLPLTERMAKELLSLPLSPVLTEEQAMRIVTAVNEFNV